MLNITSFKDITQNADLFYGQFQLRHREFMERQHYDVRAINGMEFDEYDTLATVYLVYSTDGKTVLGLSRLTPVGYGCMLQDHFPDLVGDKSIFQDERVWEGTRFCIDSRLPAEERRHICHVICRGYVEYGLAVGASQIIGMMQTYILRSVFERSGVSLKRLGDIQQIGDHNRVQAASIEVASWQLDRITEVTGMGTVLPALKKAA
ncbi:acyl-homoserine-lactone synthase [Asticcacaulis sp.]|uniref:acyl-homoserine-lactone synthase n=1 Tax=Asticcacaulis sp. TaxID=1872648 RepID=UPI002B93486A|nr:acyl-homoserine-lactone synthase [Asticcacaulis sp.]HTM81891.1 acyl-homoserine-lactone synthase [Asticcacaulis sp.]